MEVDFSKKSLAQLDELPYRHREKIISEIEHLEEDYSPENSKLIQDRQGRTVSRLRIKTDRKEYRTFYRVSNQGIDILSVRPRSECYDDEFWGELEQVFRNI